MTISVGVFCPQSRAPSASYLQSIRQFILTHPILQCLVTEIVTLKEVQTLLAMKNAAINRLPRALQYTDHLIQWLVAGDGDAAASTQSGIVALPRLVILQVAQYFQYLESQQITHADVIAQVRTASGLQGYCGGLPAALALSCAASETEVGPLICTAIRLAYAIGLYAELGDDSTVPGATTIVVRLKSEGQAEDLVRHCRHTYISAITDPRSVSLVGPVDELAALQERASDLGLLVQAMDLRGKTHNPENMDLARDLVAVCRESEMLQLPGPEHLKSPVRSNRTGDFITGRGSLSEEIVQTVLASRCEWYQLLCNVARGLQETGTPTHQIVSFGVGDVVPLMPFNKLGLRIEKQDWGAPKRRLGPEKLPSYPDDAIAIVGASCRLPGANTMEELWGVLSEGQDRHEMLPRTRFDLHGAFRARQSGPFAAQRQFYGNFLDGIDQFDHAFFGISKREMANIDPQQRVLLELAYEAMESSGYLKSHRRDRGDSVGCFIGASFVEYLDNTNAHAPTAYTSTGTIRAFLCGRLSYYFGWRGPAEVIDTACSSSLVAINRAVKAIQRGECSIALTGGINLITGINNFLDLARAGFLSPTGQCKPFDERADGYCRAEGAGLVVLKPLKQALMDKDRVMAVIPGAATNQGGLSCGITVPEPKAQVELYRAVLDQARLDPAQITYVEAHGTGTQAGHPLEVQSIRSVLGGSTRSTDLTIGSVKGNIGHCETAAGVAGLLKVICMLERRSLVPQASHTSWNPTIPALAPDRMRLCSTLQPWTAPLLAALVNSYGAAGSNAAIVCCESPRQPSPQQQQQEQIQRRWRYPVICSASTESSLRRYQQALAAFLRRTSPPPAMAAVAYTLSEKRPLHKYASIVESEGVEDLARQLADGAPTPIIERTSSPAPIVLVFGGQSRKTIGLRQDLYQHCVAFRAYLDLCNDTLQELGYPSILPAVFDTTELSDIVVLQTGFVSVQYASALTWIDAGVEVTGLLGHSLGELTCLAVSGMLSLRDMLRLVAGRATSMKVRWGGDRGKMSAVFASLEEVKALIEGQPLEIACYNAENSYVVSGETRAMANLQARLLASPVRSVAVDTSHGFHSMLVEPVVDDLNRLGESLHWSAPQIPVYPCSREARDTPLPYNPGAHAREPVFFAHAVRRIEARLGACIWLEAGMDTPIIQMTKRAAASQTHAFCAMATKDGVQGLDALSHTVASLWSLSVPVTHWPFLQPHDQVWLPPYQFEATRGWLHNVDRAAEIQQQLDQHTTAAAREDARHAKEDAIPRSKLVSLLPLTGDRTEDQVRHFRIDGMSERFRRIVSGHAVRQRPLCPASVYLECVAMALDLIGEQEGGRPMKGTEWAFEDLSIQAPLATGAEMIELTLEESPDAAGRRYMFLVRSRSQPLSNNHTLHAKGCVTRERSSNLQPVGRLLGRHVQALQDSGDVERMQAKRAYGLFSRVVTYAEFLRGISQIRIRGSEGLATVIIPGGQPGLDESTAIARCDAVSLDNFIQVVGLLINTSELVGVDEVMVCTGIDNCTLSKECDLPLGDGDQRDPAQVYVSYNDCGSGQAVGDVFAFSSRGTLIAAITGCHFTKMAISRLERLLDTVNRTTAAADQARAVAPVAVGGRPMTDSSEAEMPMTPDLSSETGPEENEDEDEDEQSPPDVRAMLESYTGATASKILNTAVLTDLGLDSLAAVEMLGELAAFCDITLDSQDLLTTTVQELETQIGRAHSARRSPPRRHPPRATAEKPCTAAARPSRDMTRGVKAIAQVMQVISELTGIEVDQVQHDMTLEKLGVDSLALVEVVAAVSDAAALPISSEGIVLSSTIADLLALLPRVGQEASQPEPPSNTCPAVTALLPPTPTPIRPSLEQGPSWPRVRLDPMRGMRYSNAKLANHAARRGYTSYWDDVAVRQDQQTLAYVVQAFATLGVDLQSMRPGEAIPHIEVPPQYRRLLQRLWAIVMKHGAVAQGGQGVRSRGPKEDRIPPPDHLHAEFVAQYPTYAIEARLLALTAPHLATALQGSVDPVKLLFGSPAASQIMEEYYGCSPMLSTATDQMVDFVTGCIGGSQPKAAVFRILEVGAGTGGTTVRLVEALAKCGVAVHYTFTDISASMVAKARRRFAHVEWMHFERLDLEQASLPHMRGSFDMVIGTNCVHATRNRVLATSRIREMLAPEGLIVLSEVTRIIDWYDLVFGLLDGWWLAADEGLAYPLQAASEWVKSLHRAGFGSVLVSEGRSEDLNTQQLLSPILRAPATTQMAMIKESVTYKIVHGVELEADVFLPAPSMADVNLENPMAIALMVHGGGHMTLSRQSVRPAQTAYLLANGFVPVSIDYRLCPEINIIDGAMADVRDAYLWARHTLPKWTMLRQRGIQLDAERIVLVGWSTGGQLAMSTAWTVAAAGERLPSAILSFYSPCDFLSTADVFASAQLPPVHAFTDQQVLEIPLARNPLTQHEVNDFASGRQTGSLGWLKPGDPRSELLLSMCRQDKGYGLSLMLNGGRSGAERRQHRRVGDLIAEGWPSNERQAWICPTAQLMAGNYRVPTFIIHGRQDEVARFESAERFHQELQRQEIASGMLQLEHAHHIYDLHLKPGMVEWDEQVAPGYNFLFNVVG
ncbi:uncharacterized protein BO72DRAFT_484062 [Aspergillus fijiensis CBS 313.89]|uniref:Polyketide synthase n=1 Tax=Aspergillus fijiensis CBS 313.89 TaxID=1448319 RepID=A0A8G1RXP8_9EURO|nr:uncharacterized protein BO72DRAFT_484062 [Aspergillus fijiensis CBS 313.89]RAK80213.1 hypothetical protein BO72DRAFT_484062 [Aspergillus fijiensis CBS 313.89]